MYHLLVIHLLVVGVLGCFQSLSIVSIVVINKSVQVTHFFGYMPVLLDCMVGLLLDFYRTSIVVLLIFILNSYG
jgi:hypothetical protein